VYITAGLPSPAALPGFVRDFASARADIVELGVPFTDPLADGPVIQAGHERGIRAGVTPAVVLDLVGEIRKSTAIPIILMGDANSFIPYGSSRSNAPAARTPSDAPSGFESYLRDAASAGVAGLIVPDLPPEEGGAYREAASAAGLVASLRDALDRADR
jgi:tryptophan synthase alpha chain